MNESLEAKLEHLLQVDAPATLPIAIRARVRAAARTDDLRSQSQPRARLRLGRSIAIALLATLGLAAATIGALELYERVVQAAPSGDRLAWERAVQLDLTVETEAGTMTVARGYADTNRIVLGIGSSARDVVGGTELRDTTGRVYQAFGGSGYVEPSGESVMLETWLAPEPLPLGDVELILTPHAGAEHWELTFTLPVNGGGIALTPMQTTSAEGVAITLEEFAVSPTSLVWTMRFAGLDPERSWAPASMSWIKDGDDSIAEAFITGGAQGEDGMYQIHIAYAGTDAPSGEWTLRVGELVGELVAVEGQGQQVRIGGPWEFVVSVP